MGLEMEGKWRASNKPGLFCTSKKAEGVFSSKDTPTVSHLLLALREFRAAHHPKRSEGSRALEAHWLA